MRSGKNVLICHVDILDILRHDVYDNDLLGNNE